MKKLALVFLFITCFIFAEVPTLSSQKIEDGSFVLLCGNSNKELGEEVASCLGIPLNKARVDRFNDGEISIQIQENIRGKDVFIIQSSCISKNGSVNDNLMELYLLIRACKRASANKITAIMPYFGYARQDRKDKSRVPISASDVAMLIENAGLDHVIAIDLHCGQIQGFFHDIAVDNLMTSVVFVPYIAKKEFSNLVVVAPDAGAVSRAKNFIAGLKHYGINANMAIFIKQRLDAGVIDQMNIIGNVKDCDVLIVDDICDTAGTIVKAASELKKSGAQKIYACISHPVFSKDAIEKIKASVFDELIVTNSIPLREAIPPNITQISIAPLIAEAIKRANNSESLSDLFNY